MCPLGEIRFFYTLSKGPGNRTHVPGENFPIQAYQKDVKMNLGKIEFQTNL